MSRSPREHTVTELFGLPPAPKTGRERLVAAAIELFYAHGFQAVGIDQIIATAGVTKTTFYKHFESKDELMVAAVKQRDKWEQQAFQHAIKKLAGDDPRAQLLAVFDVFDVWFNDPAFRGCVFINTAAEFPNPHDPVHQAAAEHKRRNRDEAREMAARAGVRAPDAFADQYIAMVEGTLILRQVHGRNDAARVIRPAVEALLADNIPPVSESTPTPPSVEPPSRQ
jgi:AcrR family transcriptional regulator